MREIDLVYRTMFAELGQRCLDAAFTTDFPLHGRFVGVTVKGRSYWYFDEPHEGRTRRRYVGPQADPDITRRVEAFKEVKSDARARRKLVSTLTREAGLPAPERFTGDVVAALATAGLFRLRGVLVGAVAFQCYSGLLGVRLPAAQLQTGDADFAQFHSISAAVEDSLPPMLEVLRSVDPSFREIPHQMDARWSTRFVNADRFAVEFLTPNRGSGDLDGQPFTMPALGGAAAQPLRFLDFLIYEPVRSVMLHGSGVPVLVPAPERYAVHKLIVSVRRRTDPDGPLKRDKDRRQAELLCEALIATRRRGDLATAYGEAWARGPSWREALKRSLRSLDPKIGSHIGSEIASGLRELGETAAATETTSAVSGGP